MSFIQPPFVGIAQLLRTGRVVPFLGAGVNTRPPDASGWTRAAPFLPRGAELARALADINGFPSEEPGDRTDLAKVASYGVEYLGRPWLRDALRQVFDRDYEPCDIHTYLASVPAPLLVVTTNYDDLTERAFQRAGRPFDLVVHPTDNDEYAAAVLWTKHGEPEPVPVKPNLLQIDLANTTVIYKMHGNVYRGAPAGAAQAWDSYVITEDDYVDFLSRMTGQTAVPSIFIRHFRDRQFLFLGYGLNDWNLRVVLRNLRNVLPDADAGAGGGARRQQPSWAIQFRPSPLEVALWGARGVKIFDLGIDEFVQGLRGAEAAP